MEFRSVLYRSMDNVGLEIASIPLTSDVTVPEVKDQPWTFYCTCTQTSLQTSGPPTPHTLTKTPHPPGPLPQYLTSTGADRQTESRRVMGC